MVTCSPPASSASPRGCDAARLRHPATGREQKNHLWSLAPRLPYCKHRNLLRIAGLLKQSYLWDCCFRAAAPLTIFLCTTCLLAAPCFRSRAGLRTRMATSCRGLSLRQEYVKPRLNDLPSDLEPQHEQHLHNARRPSTISRPSPGGHHAGGRFPESTWVSIGRGSIDSATLRARKVKFRAVSPPAGNETMRTAPLARFVALPARWTPGTYLRRCEVEE